MAPDLSLHSSRRQPDKLAAHLPKLDDRHGPGRPLAWRSIQLLGLGPAAWPISSHGTSAPAADQNAVEESEYWSAFAYDQRYHRFLLRVRGLGAVQASQFRTSRCVRLGHVRYARNRSSI